MNYKPDATLAFASVEYIMRDVPWGWLIRYMHSTGASMFFVVVYLHMFRGLLYGSYRKPRELVWMFGCAIFLCLMAEAFFGYLLPWGQMSFWGAQVIVNLFSAIPFIGPDLSLWIRGDYVVSDVTLNRFFAFHVIAIPLVLIGLVVAHLVALHEVGSNNPDGIEIKAKKDEDGIPLDGIPFHPYYSVHDFMGVCVFLFIFCRDHLLRAGNGRLLPRSEQLHSGQSAANAAGNCAGVVFHGLLRDAARHDRSIQDRADGRGRAARRAGVVARARQVAARLAGARCAAWSSSWRSTESKFWGVVVMGTAVVSLFFLPWLDRSPVKSIRYRPLFHKVFYGVFVFAFLIARLSRHETAVAGQRRLLAQICALIYFAFFLGMPFWTTRGRFKQPPDRVRFKPLTAAPTGDTTMKKWLSTLALIGAALLAFGAAPAHADENFPLDAAPGQRRQFRFASTRRKIVCKLLPELP